MEKEIRSLRKIEMPEEMKRRIIENCYNERVEKTVKKFYRKPALIAATLAIVICIGSITAFALPERIQGFFSDIFDWKGAVTGTAYENATDEIEVSAAFNDGKITVGATFLQKENAPYLYIEELGIGSCTVKDAEDKTVFENIYSEKIQIKDGKAVIELDCEDLVAGEYTVVIDEFVGGAKAEQDLAIRGVWKCDISVK